MPTRTHAWAIVNENDQVVNIGVPLFESALAIFAKRQEALKIIKANPDRNLTTMKISLQKL